MSLFEQNLNLLQQKDSSLANRLETEPEDTVVTLQKSKTGMPVAIVECNGQKYALHDPNDPLRHAQNFLNQIKGLRETRNLAILGCGLGYIPLYIQQANPNIRHFYVFEPSLSVFRNALKIVDFSPLLQSANVEIVVGQEPGQVYNTLMNHLMDLVANSILLVDYHPVTAAFPNWAGNARQQVQEALRLGQSGLATKFKDGPRTMRNLIRNLDWLAKSPGIIEIGDICHNVPAVIVAAGPSLMKNIEILHKYQQQLLIIASDTVYNLLLDHGIFPEFVVTVDPTELNLKHFPSEHYGPDSFLIFDPEARSEIVQKFTHRLTYMTDKHPIFRWLDKMVGPKGSIAKGGMVSQAAMQIALYLECSPVILIGQDLAFDSESCITHAPKTALSREVSFLDDDREHVDVYTPDHSTSNREPLYWVEGATQDKVPTVHSFLVYLRMLENDIRNTKTPIIDATEGGAKIAGTIVQSLEETARKLQHKNINLSEIMTTFLVNLKSWKPPAVQNVKEQLRSTLQNRVELAEQGLREIEKTPNASLNELETRMESYRTKIFTDPVAEYLIESAAPQELFEFLKLEPANASADEKRRKLVERWNALLKAVQKANEELKNEL